MSQEKIYELQDLILKIDEADKMVKLHQSNPSPFMLKQYEAKKEKLLGYLIDELAGAELRSTFSFHLIVLAIRKYYPQIIQKRVEADKSHDELRGLEAILV